MVRSADGLMTSPPAVVEAVDVVDGAAHAGAPTAQASDAAMTERDFTGRREDGKQ
jgi:hypothetical protein